ncbi:MAG: PAS domain S-box protein [Betaproteobacteria bacterium]|nr:PAS domain S-box protein [Betaproteobacteria bacterium]
MPSAAVLDPARRNRRERLLLAAVVLALGLWLVFGRMGRLAGTEAAETKRLAVQADAIERNLAWQLQGVAAALRVVRDDLPEWPVIDRPRALGLRLQALCAAMPGVHRMMLVDADGRPVAVGGPDAAVGGPDAVGWFAAVRARPDPAVLHVALPAAAPSGEVTLTLAVAVTDAQGALAGAVAATLDPAYFDTLLGSMLYADDMSARIVHADGVALVVSPPDGQPLGVRMGQTPSILSRHLATGQPASVQRGTSQRGDERIVALRTLQPPTLAMDKALIIAVSRQVEALRAPWRQLTELLALLWLGGSAAATVGLLAMQRRRREREVEAAERLARQAADAERLRLALQGGDLALWDLDVPRDHATVNERWSTMLGYALDELDGGGDAWQRLLHPEDLERVKGLRRAHLDGHSASFEATYRLRHRDGHWIWVLDRGRVVERDSAGRALRMVGTHMDITARVQAEETLRRSEQSLAVTLQSIGDAVIATDGAGRITRINDAARRLTGWQGQSAIGQPLGEVFRIFDAETRQAGIDPVARVLASGAVVGLDNGTLLVARDGREHQIADSAAPIRTDDGAVLGVVLVFSDVTEQYRMVQALRRSEQKSRALLAALRSGVVVHAPDTQVLDANPSACRILGLTLDQVRGKVVIDPSWAFLEEDGTPMAMARFPVNQVLSGADVVRNLVIGLRRPDLSTPVWALCTAFALRDDAGVLQEVVVTFYDITERKQAEEALQRSAARLRLAGRLARLGGWSLELASGRVELSADAAAVMGAATQPASLHLDEILALVLPTHRARLEAALQGADAFDLEVEAVMPNGRALTLRLMGEPVRDELGRRVAMQGAVQDVTESRQEQQQLRLLQTAVAQLDDMVLITAAEPLEEPGPPIVFVNAAFERVTGWRSDEVLGRSPRLLQCDATDRRELDRMHQALQRHEPIHTELLNVARDGRAYWVDIQVAPLFDASGRVTHMVAVERDITDRKRTEAQAREVQEALAATLEAVPDLLFELDIEGRVHLYHSPRSDLLYVPPEAFLGKRVADILPPEAADTIAKAVREAHEQGYSGGGQYMLMLNGSAHWFELSVSRKATAPGELPRVIALARNITERKHGEAHRVALERQLRDAHKIESIGTLAGGIAHDFNNILPAILGNVALARQDLPPGHPALASLEQIQRAGLRARTLVQQILTFSRRQPQALVAQPLQPVLQETLALLRATLPAAVRLDTAIVDDPTPVEVDGTQLQQVLMNLCTNAWHALPEGRGHIEVGLDVVDAAEAQRLGDGVPRPGRFMHLWVRDDGSGMDAATRERIFDPFFTTKPVGQGTGLGLSVVHGIVRGHRGSLGVESTPGVGSCFHVLLPLSAATPSGPGALDEAAAPASAGRGEIVWYVDDDPVMALMVQRLLQREGYTVTVCEGPVQALARARETDMPPALVITDFNMPELSGLELAAELSRLWPAVPIVLTTGYVGDALQAEAARHGVRALLRKENTLEDLPVLVRRLVGTAPTR